MSYQQFEYFLKMKKKEKALKILEKSKSKNGTKELMESRLLLENGEWQEAYKKSKLARMLGAPIHEVLFIQSMVYFHNGLENKGLLILKEAYLNNPKEIKILENLAFGSLELQKEKETEKWVEKLLKVAPNHELGKHIKELILNRNKR